MTGEVGLLFGLRTKLEVLPNSKSPHAPLGFHRLCYSKTSGGGNYFDWESYADFVAQS